jgi:hypothetical protein
MSSDDRSSPARTLHALGFDGVPLREPLLYPGRLVEGPTLLSDGQLFELGVADDRLGAWPVQPHGDRPLPVPCAQGARGDPRSGSAVALDALLDGLGLPRADDRYPVLSVGSNAAPGQLCHKLASRGLSDTVPMVPVRVRGIAVALSAHISAAGYVSASPVLAPDAETPLVVTWLDREQLAAVDETEASYRRAFLPGEEFPMELPSGRRLGGAYLYCHARGVLGEPGGTGPRTPDGDQSAVLAGLLADSPRLRELLGPAPADWVRRIRDDASLRARGTELFEAEGWLLEEPGFAPYTVGPGDEITYRDLDS